MIKTAAADQNAEQQIAEAQEMVRQCFRDLRQEIDQREEMVMAEVPACLLANKTPVNHKSRRI